MVGEELSSFSMGLGLGRDDNELSDDDGDGAAAIEKDINGGGPQDEYFTGELASFAAGCHPSAEE